MVVVVVVLVMGMVMVVDHLMNEEESAIDSAYSEYLEERLEKAEELLDKMEVKGDEVEEARDRERRREVQISKCLPRTRPQKFDGTVNDFVILAMMRSVILC